jgi:hypothetical protein
MTKDEIIAQGYEQIKRIPTLPRYQTYLVAVKNVDFGNSTVLFESAPDSFNLFYFLRFRQKTVTQGDSLKARELQEWEFEEFANSNKTEVMAEQQYLRGF